MKKLISLLLVFVLLFASQASTLRSFASDGRSASVERAETEPDDSAEKDGSFFKSALNRICSFLSILCDWIKGKLGVQTEKSEGEAVISDIYMDKARYLPGEKPVLTVTLQSGRDAEIGLTVKATHLSKPVFESETAVSLEVGEPVTLTIDLDLPETDFTAYAVEVYAAEAGKTPDSAMTAAEVASDWSRFPRYGYLTNYTAQTDEELDATIDRLNRYHITGLFFYDVLDRHDQPLAGTPESPDATWQTLARQTASFGTVKGLIDRGHERGMDSFLYNLLFGAYQDYADRGIDRSWGLFRDSGAVQQDFHGELPGSWETQRIYLFDPANENWQDHYLKVTKDALDAFGYDGLQTDSLGGRGTLYDAEGNEVNLAQNYVPFLNRLRDELDTKVIFNPVSGYGSDEMLSETDYDIVYEEFWEGDGQGYHDLRNEVYRLRDKMTDDKGIVIAAYMDKDSSAEAFNPAGILLTDATLMASGAAHLELGDTGMLKSEYYPGSTLKIGEDLDASLKSYYSFFVAYENILRDAAFKPSDKMTKVDLKTVPENPKKNGIWCINREKENGDMVLNFINFKGVEKLDWPDADGTQTMPKTRRSVAVRQYVSRVPGHVYLASPDLNGGIMEELNFTSGKDLRGNFISFVMPELRVWNTVYLTV